ncbi:MAG: translation initiation factor IF-3 [Candidatus Magasanikbacteria bacterium]
MRISRKRRTQKPLIPRYKINHLIKVPEVRVIDSEGNNLGVISTSEALQQAQTEELDLVEINPKAEPPVCQIIDFTRFKYQKEKEARKQKTNSHVAEMKGIRLSVRIGEHDMNIRQAQTEKFLNRGDKAKIEIILRGRERGKLHVAFEIVNAFVVKIKKNMNIHFEQEPTQQGNKVTAIIIKS